METTIRTYRDHMAEILALASSGAGKTHLVYSANLNFKIVKNLLNKLQTNGLIEKHDKHFYTTDKGNQFLYYFNNVKELIPNA